MNTTTRQTRRTAASLVAAVATFAAAGCAGATEQHSAPLADDGVSVAVVADQASAGPSPDVVESTSQTDDAAEDAADQIDDSAPPPAEQPPAPPADAGDGDGGPVDLPPVPQTDPHPCDFLVADGSSLVVGPDPVVLEPGDMTGTITIVNCTDGDVDWTAKTKPSVELDDSGANLLPGETAELDFTIDGDQWAAGAIDFKIKVSEPGHNHYVDVHAFRQLSGKDFVADVGGLTAGPGAGGCANQCITSALLQPNATSPNVGIDITTNTEATITTWVLNAAPIQIDGVPLLQGVAPMDVSPDGVSTHSALLAPLDASTKYHIVVAATDEFDHTAYRIGSFTTITPVEGPGGFATAGDPPGCAAQCVTKAQLTGGADETSKHIGITTHTAARIQVFVSTDAPTWSNGVPSFADADLWLPSGLEYITEWEADLEGLAASTDYHIIVSAIDANDHADYRVGEFRTDDAPTFDVVFTVLDVHVDDDGDKGANRGEMRFGWRVGDDAAGYIDEAKVSSGDTVHFPSSNSTYVAHDISEWLPTVYVAATERDADGKVEFCSMGLGVPREYGRNENCDVMWNVASSGLITLDSLTGYAPCLDPALADHRCLTLTTPAEPTGYPEITAHIAVLVVD